MLQLILPGPNGGFTITDQILGKFPTLGALLSEALKYAFPLAGIILFFVIIFSGYGFLTSAGDPEKTKKNQGMLVSAIIGFFIIFLAYWLMEILEKIVGIKVLG